MVSVLLDVRRARQRRWALPALCAVAVALPFLARLAPRAAPLLAPPTITSVLLAGVPGLCAAAVAAWVGREARWSLADDIAWAVAFLGLGALAGTAGSAFTAAMTVYVLALVLLAVRVPPPRLMVAAVLSTLLPVLVWALTGASALTVGSLGLAAVCAAFVHVTLGRATHSLAFVLSEREALLTERRARPRDGAPRSRTSRTSTPSVSAASASEVAALGAPSLGSSSEEVGWEALVERVRTSLSSLCDPAGIVASVHAELAGLAPPNHKIRQGVVKIVQEAASHAMRDTAPTSISVTLRRGDGGLLMEVQDDGPTGESVRVRRTLASLRGRVIPLGGSAEVKRSDGGWVLRVKLPCDQLN